MKAPHQIFAVLATAGLVSAVQFSDIAACGQQCYNDVKNNFATYGCSSATDLACLCANANFSNGIRDCANQSCVGASASSAALLQTYSQEQCDAVKAVQTQPNPGSTSSPQPPGPSVIPTTTTAAQATTSVASVSTTTGAAATTQTGPSTTANASPTTTPASSTSSTSSPSTTPTSPATALTTLTTAATSNSAVAATASAASSSSSNSNSDSNTNSQSSGADSSSEDETDSGGNLSNSTKIGIGVGCGAAVVVLAALLFALCRRRRDKKQLIRANNKSDLEISVPLPGSGRLYASDGSSSNTPVTTPRGFRRSHHDIPSTRYENMIPRTQPSLTLVKK